MNRGATAMFFQDTLSVCPFHSEANQCMLPSQINDIYHVSIQSPGIRIWHVCNYCITNLSSACCCLGMWLTKMSLLIQETWKNHQEVWSSFNCVLSLISTLTTVTKSFQKSDENSKTVMKIMNMVYKLTSPLTPQLCWIIPYIILEVCNVLHEPQTAPSWTLLWGANALFFFLFF